MHPGFLNRADVEPQAPFAQPRPGDRHFIDSPQTEYSTQLKLRLQVHHGEQIQVLLHLGHATLKLRLQVHHREQIPGVVASGSCNIEAETTNTS